MDEYGIELLKEIFKDGIEAGVKIEEALTEDSPKGKKISLVQEGIPLFIFVLPKVISHVGDAEQIKNEFNDLSQTELDELKAYIVEELDLANDIVEDLIEAFLDWLDSTNDFRLAIKDLVDSLNEEE